MSPPSVVDPRSGCVASTALADGRCPGRGRGRCRGSADSRRLRGDSRGVRPPPRLPGTTRPPGIRRRLAPWRPSSAGDESTCRYVRVDRRRGPGPRAKPPSTEGRRGRVLGVLGAGLERAQRERPRGCPCCLLGRLPTGLHDGGHVSQASLETAGELEGGAPHCHRLEVAVGRSLPRKREAFLGDRAGYGGDAAQ